MQPTGIREKIALVTGAGGGIGAAIVRSLHAEGAHVVAIDSNRLLVSALAAEVSTAEAMVCAEAAEVRNQFFGGAVGWCDAESDGQRFVSIRCAELGQNSARLYAEAGIVVGSDPEAEANETAAKFPNALRALGVDEDGRRPRECQ